MIKTLKVHNLSRGVPGCTFALPSSKGIINLEFSAEQTIGKKKDKVFDVKTDKDGGYKQDGLIPCDVTVFITLPQSAELCYTLVKELTSGKDTF
jgi:hypothetical protein